MVNIKVLMHNNDGIQFLNREIEDDRELLELKLFFKNKLESFDLIKEGKGEIIFTNVPAIIKFQVDKNDSSISDRYLSILLSRNFDDLMFI